MSNIYFTSDTHYNHSNIAGKNCSKWKEGFRNYNSLQEMNEDIVKNFNKTLKEDDILYHLGDWSFGGIDSIYDFWKQLKCKNIHLILGNHDHHIEEDKMLPNCHRSTFDPYPIIDNAPVAQMYSIDAIELFLSVNQVKTIKINQDTFFLSHYSHRIWYGSHKQVIHLYGHSHDSLDKDGFIYGKSMDVGIDSAIRILGEAKPFHIDEIRAIMKNRKVKFIDHHNSKTNMR